MSLSDREKFIVHLITVRVAGAMDNAPEAADKVLGTLKDARVRKLSEEEVAQDILPPVDSGISLDDTSTPEEPPIDLSENPNPTGKSNPEAPAVNP